MRKDQILPGQICKINFNPVYIILKILRTEGNYIFYNILYRNTPEKPKGEYWMELKEFKRQARIVKENELIELKAEIL